MVSVPSPFGGSDDSFDAYDEFVPEHVPVPGEFLEGHDTLAGRRHLAFHRVSRELFEERAVYDMTFGYNLARLNCDTRHPDAGYRYAVENPDRVPDAMDEGEDGLSTVDEDARVLRAEFTPTTAFCPQSDTLTKGSFRAWNGLADRHEFDLVRVRVAPMHQRAAQINAALRDLEATFVETGELPEPSDDGGAGPDTEIDDSEVPGAPGRDGSQTPF
ncbi:hypothetical protein [Halosimplex salinum]|uniref:hypothetical protein n=1 Tax=Halosimplex salinum TaxID=1710538 RepID=UPI000F4768D5|nr:hypothetical protein [Halosimplex salinum]